MSDGMDNEEDKDFMRQCEDLAQGMQNVDKERWQRAAASFRRMAEHEPKQESDRNSRNQND